MEKRVHETSLTQSETNKRIKRVENTQADLVQSVEEVRTNTSNLGKTISTWLPRYEAAARVVNDLSSKVERVEERFEGFACDEGLEQQISRVAETKVQSLKDLVISTSAMKDIGLDLQDLHERVENSERAQFQVLGHLCHPIISEFDSTFKLVSAGKVFFCHEVDPWIIVSFSLDVFGMGKGCYLGGCMRTDNKKRATIFKGNFPLH